MNAELYSELCDLFEQAIWIGKTGEYSRQPCTDPDRIKGTSDQARNFANAVSDLLDTYSRSWRKKEEK